MFAFVLPLIIAKEFDPRLEITADTLPTRKGPLPCCSSFALGPPAVPSPQRARGDGDRLRDLLPPPHPPPGRPPSLGSLLPSRDLDLDLDLLLICLSLCLSLDLDLDLGERDLDRECRRG